MCERDRICALLVGDLTMCMDMCSGVSIGGHISSGQGHGVLGQEESFESYFSVGYWSKWGETCVHLSYLPSSSTDSVYDLRHRD